MPPLSATVQGIRAGVFSVLQKHIDAHAARGGDLVPLQIGDTWLEPPAEAWFSAGRGAEAALYDYGATAGLAPLRAAIARFVAEARGIPDVSPDHEVLVGAGGTHALYCAARSILDQDDEVLLAAPYWPLSHGVLASCGARVVEVSLTDRLYADPSLDAGELFRPHVTARTRAIYLITPNNPDGKMLSRAHLEQIAALAQAHDLWVIADEVYADHTFDAEHVSMCTLPGMRSRTITAYSLSKSHALAGARVGYVLAPPEVIAAARRVSTHSVYNVPVIAQRAALAALTAARRWPAHARDVYREARDRTVEGLAGLPLRFSVAEGGTYLFLDFAPLLNGRPLDDLLQRAIDRGVLLAPGKAFGLAYESWARLCYSAVPLERLQTGLDRLRAAIAQF